MYLIRTFGDSFRVTFGISGMALEQFEMYTPWMIDSFRKLYKTGNVEFVSEPYSFSLAMLGHAEEYARQLEQHQQKLLQLFGCKPKVLMHTNMIYSNELAYFAHKAGLQTIVTDGSKHIPYGLSANITYTSCKFPDVRLLLRNSQLSDDISYNFSEKEWCEWPLTAGKFSSWLNALDNTEDVVNLFLDYAALGEYQHTKTGIFDFFEAFIAETIRDNKRLFRTVSEVSETIKPAGALDINDAVSWADREKDLSAWLGNDIQQDAFASLYSVADAMRQCKNEALLSDWNRLQTCDHFYYMSTKNSGDFNSHQYFSPYSSPYEAFVNYMNILTDFIIRVDDYAGRSSEQGQSLLKHDDHEVGSAFRVATF
jgi:alpha-amylase